MNNEQEKQIRSLKDLLIIVADDTIRGALVAYAETQYNRAINTLRNAKDLIDIGRAQGEVVAWEHIIKLKERVMDTVNKSGR